MRLRRAVILVSVFAMASCARRDRARETPSTTNADVGDANPASIASVTPPPEPIGPVNVVVPGDRYAVVVRGRHEAGTGTAMLFMAGMCVHPGGYAGAFQYTAAERGDLVALQGDVSCGGGADSPVRMWSYDLEALDRRVDAAFAAAGLGAPKEIVAIGYSQGAERAEQLAARWPKKYSRVVLIASPIAPSAQRLARARAVATMAGTHDISLERMQSAAADLQRAHVPARFFLLPNAHHGQMGEAPEDSMRAALDFVTETKPRE